VEICKNNSVFIKNKEKEIHKLQIRSQTQNKLQRLVSINTHLKKSMIIISSSCRLSQITYYTLYKYAIGKVKNCKLRVKFACSSTKPYLVCH